MQPPRIVYPPGTKYGLHPATGGWWHTGSFWFGLLGGILGLVTGLRILAKRERPDWYPIGLSRAVGGAAWLVILLLWPLVQWLAVTLPADSGHLGPPTAPGTSGPATPDRTRTYHVLRIEQVSGQTVCHVQVPVSPSMEELDAWAAALTHATGSIHPSRIEFYAGTESRENWIASYEGDKPARVREDVIP